MKWEGVLLLGIFVESTVQWMKKEYRNHITYFALVLGLLIAFATKANLLIMAGIWDYSPFQMVGTIMFGCVLARGANFVNDMVSLLSKSRR